MLSQEKLKSIINYNEKTGVFSWKVGIGKKIKKGDIAGAIDHAGYIRIQIEGIKHAAHRLAFLYMEGFFPEHDVDHINGIRHDNRWEVLRHATRSCNTQNTKIRATNKSGFPGVCWSKTEKKWKAKIYIRGIDIFLGWYADKLEAALARYTFESQCEEWSCRHRGVLVQAITACWPSFKGAKTK